MPGINRQNWTHYALKLAQVILDVLVIIFAAYTAYRLRFSNASIPPAYIELFRSHLPFLILIRLLFLFSFKVYRIYWRYMGLRDLQKIIAAIAGSAVAFGAFILTTFHLNIYPYPNHIAAGHSARFPLGIVLMDCVLSIVLFSAIRMMLRLIGDAHSGNGERVRKVLIVGAGAVGVALARDLNRLSKNNSAVLGFVDANPVKHGALINGIPVFGGDESIEQIVHQEAVDDVIIAIPRAAGSQIRRIVALCESLPVRLRIFPGFDSFVTDDIDPSQLRDIDVEDLLRRPPVRIDVEEVASYIAGERLLITGAGGSIGSELCRQIAGLHPEELILVGQGENSIFEIDQELRQDHGMKAIPVICDIKDRSRLDQVFAQYRPTVVFHAAAHKHVPLMEANPGEAVKNNIGGTRNLAELSTKYKVKRFVQISTDKAVNPTSIMGATKRVCEMIVEAENRRSETAFMAVRFGNVLGSRGSVVPLMKKQIARGGPVTVTHPEIVRYFMTIPEAVQLVIQAGALGKGGEIFMLDMGEPVKIMELARDLIRLSGLVPDKDIRIQVTGLRPGEKLYEELLTAQEGTTATLHEKIFIAAATQASRELLDSFLGKLETAASEGAADSVRLLLRELVPAYLPNGKQPSQVSIPNPASNTPDSAVHLQA